MKLKAEGIERVFFRNSKNTNTFKAVDNTDFELYEGGITEIVGRSGSGKTTFINMLSGLLAPSSGRVYLGEHDLYGLDDKKRSALRNKHIGMIPQGQTGLQGLTVLENIMLPAVMYGNKNGAEERAQKLIDTLGIGELSDVYSNELSGGELRRMSIARGLINSPEIVIADEPTGDLDDEATEYVMKLFREYAKQGCSVMIVTHEKDVMTYADRIFRMDKGILTEIKKNYCD